MSVPGESQASCRVSKLIGEVVVLGHHARTGDGSRTFRDDPRGQGKIGQCVQAGAVILEKLHMLCSTIYVQACSLLTFHTSSRPRLFAASYQDFNSCLSSAPLFLLSPRDEARDRPIYR